jgi:hypothetical protein
MGMRANKKRNSGGQTRKGTEVEGMRIIKKRNRGQGNEGSQEKEQWSRE